MVCKSMNISRHQLFSRKIKQTILHIYHFDIFTEKHELDNYKLSILQLRNPLSQMWECHDVGTWWLFRYWKHSHWRDYIQLKLDLGLKLKNILAEILKRKSLDEKHVQKILALASL